MLVYKELRICGGVDYGDDKRRFYTIVVRYCRAENNYNTNERSCQVLAIENFRGSGVEGTLQVLWTRVGGGNVG